MCPFHVVPEGSVQDHCLYWTLLNLNTAFYVERIVLLIHAVRCISSKGLILSSVGCHALETTDLQAHDVSRHDALWACRLFAARHQAQRSISRQAKPGCTHVQASGPSSFEKTKYYIDYCSFISDMSSRARSHYIIDYCSSLSLSLSLSLSQRACVEMKVRKGANIEV